VLGAAPNRYPDRHPGRESGSLTALHRHESLDAQKCACWLERICRRSRRVPLAERYLARVREAARSAGPSRNPLCTSNRRGPPLIRRFVAPLRDYELPKGTLRGGAAATCGRRDDLRFPSTWSADSGFRTTAPANLAKAISEARNALVVGFSAARPSTAPSPDRMPLCRSTRALAPLH